MEAKTYNELVEVGKRYVTKYCSECREDELCHYGVKGMKWGIRHDRKQVKKERKKYDPPYSAKQVKDMYGEELYKRLRKDPAHKWRMDTGIELIHLEPTFKELLRIRKNWDLMSDEQKEISDKKSIELFGMPNIEHFNSLCLEYIPILNTVLSEINQKK